MRDALIILLMATILFPAAEARTIVEPPKQKSASLASVIAKVEITRSTPLMVGDAECTYEYEAMPLSVMKGTLPRTSPLRFGVLGGLEVGKTYVVYLRSLGTKSEFVRYMEERVTNLEIPDQKAARAIIEACPVALPIPIFFRADRVTNE